MIQFYPTDSCLSDNNMTTRRFTILKLTKCAIMVSICRTTVVQSQPFLAAMPEAEFWTIVEQVKTAAGSNRDARVNLLERQLTTLSVAKIHAFQIQYERRLIDANLWSLWGAAFIMNGGCSDDGFKYFRDWLISEGKVTFEAALIDPEYLTRFQPGIDFELELYGYAALKAYKSVGGGELQRSFEVETATPKGIEWAEKDLPKLFPQLAAKFKMK
jgi:Protein of unknown function (DUF4240)